MAKVFTTDNFETEVLNAEKSVLVDFWATWCGPCQTMGPVVDELAQELTDVKVGKVNVDEQMALAREYKVMSIPTFLVFKDGKVAERTLGVQEKSELPATTTRRCRSRSPRSARFCSPSRRKIGRAHV